MMSWRFRLTHGEIPVRKILVTNIKPVTTHKKLKKRFIKYGKIVDCNLKKKSSLNSYAFITFEHSESAIRAIDDGDEKKIRIDGHYLKVLPAAVWHQPDRNKSTNNESIKIVDIEENHLSAYIHYSSNNESPIAILNEHCLLHIFGFLPVIDKIRMERVCRYWQIISKQSLHLCNKFVFTEDHFFSVSNPINVTLYKILKKVGFCVTVWNLSWIPKECKGNSVLIAIATLCPNIEEINLKNFSFMASGIKALAKNCTKIKHITIGDSSDESYNNVKYDKELSALFSKNRCLQYLDFDTCKINGSCLKHLSTKHITHISLTKQDCTLFVQIISKIQNLFKLYIRSCSNIDKLLEAQSFKLNAEYIKELTITHQDRYLYSGIEDEKKNVIKNFLKSSDLKNLKHLNLAWIPRRCITDELLFNLGEKFNQLTYLDISGAQEVTNSGLIWIITSLSQLKKFFMSHMYNVTDEILCCGMPNLIKFSCRKCYKMKDEGLIKFISNSDKLKVCNVSGCRSITNKLILAAIEYKKCKKENHTLLIDARQTNVDIKTIDLKENSPFLEFISSTGNTPRAHCLK